MKGTRYTEEQIIRVLQEVDSGKKPKDVCREYGISDATYYNWKAKYGGLMVSDIRRLKTLEAENSRLKQIVADQALDIQALKAINAKKF